MTLTSGPKIVTKSFSNLQISIEIANGNAKAVRAVYGEVDVDAGKEVMKEVKGDAEGDGENIIKI